MNHLRLCLRISVERCLADNLNNRWNSHIREHKCTSEGRNGVLHLCEFATEISAKLQKTLWSHQMFIAKTIQHFIVRTFSSLLLYKFFSQLLSSDCNKGNENNSDFLYFNSSFSINIF